MPYGRGGAGNLDLDDDGPEHLTEVSLKHVKGVHTGRLMSK
jgi:hypothetical protein